MILPIKRATAVKSRKLGLKMAPSRNDTVESDPDSYSNASIASSEDENLPPSERPQKRRRLSGSSEDNSFVPRTPLPTLSRIKKKEENAPTRKEIPQADPVTAKDALAMGLQTSDSSFTSLGLAPWLVSSLTTMEIKRPTAIQRACIPEILKGRDCIGGSRTGSGKTVAFAGPILHKWSEDPFGIFAVVLTPTRYVYTWS